MNTLKQIFLTKDEWAIVLASMLKAMRAEPEFQQEIENVAGDIMLQLNLELGLVEVAPWQPRVSP